MENDEFLLNMQVVALEQGYRLLYCGELPEGIEVVAIPWGYPAAQEAELIAALACSVGICDAQVKGPFERQASRHQYVFTINQEKRFACVVNVTPATTVFRFDFVPDGLDMAGLSQSEPVITN
jgi:hypothetical protein